MGCVFCFVCLVVCLFGLVLFCFVLFFLGGGCSFVLGWLVGLLVCWKVWVVCILLIFYILPSGKQ